jgi:hypothetical protein
VQVEVRGLEPTAVALDLGAQALDALVVAVPGDADVEAGRGEGDGWSRGRCPLFPPVTIA